jgi:hypothetical protein
VAARRKSAPKFKAYKKSEAGPPSNPNRAYRQTLRGGAHDKQSRAASGRRRDKNGRFK